MLDEETDQYHLRNYGNTLDQSGEYIPLEFAQEIMYALVNEVAKNRQPLPSSISILKKVKQLESLSNSSFNDAIKRADKLVKQLAW